MRSDRLISGVTTNIWCSIGRELYLTGFLYGDMKDQPFVGIGTPKKLIRDAVTQRKDFFYGLNVTVSLFLPCESSPSLLRALLILFDPDKELSAVSIREG